MKIGRKINSGQKCPECGDYTLEEKSQRIYYMPTPIENGFNQNGNYNNFYKCRKCLAEFEAIKDEK